MTYLVLARKWRPRSFDTLVGQDHVVRALTHALTTQRLHHAWLFTGTRGVGKTTLSRILAKSLNCLSGVTASPCGECSACTEIDAGRFVDYIELDAASNRGVDEMTQLLEQAVYAPSSGRFKVYMIDEVHMLSGHAFNAMLKTLEEPPPHVKFILATTDPQKIPATVLSRCLQFNLKQMTAESIISYLEMVLQQEAIQYDVPALRLLAQAASGSMRDALSLTDQAIAYSADNLTLEAIQGMLGTIDQGHLTELLHALGAGSAARIVSVADDLAMRGLSYSAALADLAVLLSHVAIEQRIPGSVSADDPRQDDIKALAAGMHPDVVQLFYSVAVHSRHELSLAPDEYAGFVMACLRMLSLVPPGTVAPPPVAGTDSDATTVQSAANTASAVAASADVPVTATVQASASAPLPASVQAQTQAQAQAQASAHAGADAPAVASKAVQGAASEQVDAQVQSESLPSASEHPQSEPAQPQAGSSAANTPAAKPSPEPSAELHEAPPAGEHAQEPSLVSPSAANPVAELTVSAPDHGHDQDSGRDQEQDQDQDSGSAPEQEAKPRSTSSPEQKENLNSAPSPETVTVPSGPDAIAPKAASPARTENKAQDTRAPEQPVSPSSDIPPWEDIPVTDEPYGFVGAEDVDDDSFETIAVSPAAEVTLATLAPEQKKTRIPRLKRMTAKEWPVLVKQLPLTGVAAQLAMQSEWLGVNGECIRLRMAIPTLAETSARARFRTVLSEHFGTVVELDIEYGETGDGTAHAIERARREKLQQQAEQSAKDDPFVNALISEFGGRLISGSIRAVI